MDDLGTDERYILLPRAGVRAMGGPAFDVLSSLPRVRSTESPQTFDMGLATEGARVRIVDTTAENGPKLVELNRQAADQLNRPDSPVRAVQVVEYRRPDLGLQPFAAPTAGPDSAGEPVEILCTDGGTGQPVAGVRVVAFTDFAQRVGAVGYTDSSGRAALRLANAKIERLLGTAPAGYWTGFRAFPPVAAEYALPLTPVDLSLVDCARYYYGKSRFDPSTGVKVGVIDTGVGPHSMINLEGGFNTVTGEPASQYEDGAAHGTHVAGLVGANGVAPTGVRGIAPGVPIRAYRVFPVGHGATNYAILKALIYAANDGCDIVNLSLGSQAPFDAIVQEGIVDARTQGMLVVVAAGNDGRATVGRPAAYSGATAVSAMGREGSYPPGTDCEAQVVRPPTGSIDGLDFIAGFSNVGPEIAVTAPGVGLLSTLPGDQFGPSSGTSMASPVVAGAAACLLSRDKVIYSMPRTVARAEAIAGLLQKNSVKRGFGAEFEGYGMPDPAQV